MFLDGTQIGEGAVGATAAMIFSADDTCDVGREDGSLVAEDYPTPNAFTGEVNWVEIEFVGEDHLIKPEDRLNLAMAFQ